MPSVPDAQIAGKRVLLTGASGFVGRHVLASGSDGAFAGAEFIALPAVDVRDREALQRELRGVRPDYVIHLAAQSFVPRSFEDPAETIEINVLGTLNLLQALDSDGFSGRFLYVSSGDVYGTVSESRLPVDEELPPAPRNPYAVSKVAAEQLCLQWHRSNRLDVVIARPFNHVGPGQGRSFVVPALAAQVVAVASGRQAPTISAGDIDVTRDFTDVRDVVSAYANLLVSGNAGKIYAVGSGIERSVRDILHRLLELAGAEADVSQDPAKFRPAEQRRMVADSSLIRQETGWTPRIPWDQTLVDILEDMESKA
jgi:GDP-4-dehydro-6-deoxy-D-mannose reductase